MAVDEVQVDSPVKSIVRQRCFAVLVLENSLAQCGHKYICSLQRRPLQRVYFLVLDKLGYKGCCVTEYQALPGSDGHLCRIASLETPRALL